MMSNPHMYAIMYVAWGVAVGFGAPAAAWNHYGPLAAIGAMLAIIHIGFGLALLLLDGEDGENDEQRSALGPSWLAGSSILFVSMTIIPLTISPAAVWMWLLPLDVHGHVGLSHSFGLNLDDFQGPHHAGGST